jgi:hypothetical protein
MAKAAQIYRMDFGAVERDTFCGGAAAPSCTRRHEVALPGAADGR